MESYWYSSHAKNLPNGNERLKNDHFVANWPFSKKSGQKSGQQQLTNRQGKSLKMVDFGLFWVIFGRFCTKKLTKWERT